VATETKLAKAPQPAAVVVGFVALFLLLLIGSIAARRRVARQVQAGLENETRELIAEADRPGAVGSFMIHMPPEGCPGRWMEVPGAFNLKGELIRGCYIIRTAEGGMVTDYLRPQENETFNLDLYEKLPELESDKVPESKISYRRR
jgi:hypothetical protein